MLALSKIDAIQPEYPCSATDFASLFLSQPVETAAAGSAIFFEGDPATHVFRIIGGNVRIFRLQADGRRTITGFLKAGDLVGLSFRNRYLFGAECIDEVMYTRMNKRRLEEELQLVPRYRMQLLTHLRDEITAAQDHMLLLSNKNAVERLCTFLLRRIEPQGPTSGLVKLPMIRADIADHLGMTIETVSRTLTKLVARGILLPVERHQFKVARLSALAHAADEHLEDASKCEGALRRHAGTRGQ